MSNFIRKYFFIDFIRIFETLFLIILSLIVTLLEVIGLSLIVDLIFNEISSVSILDRFNSYISLSRFELIFIAVSSIFIKVVIQLYIRYRSTKLSSQIQFELRNKVISDYISNDISKSNSIPNQEFINVLNENINRYSSIYVSIIQLISNLITFCIYFFFLALISIKLTAIYSIIILLLLPLLSKFNKLAYNTGHVFIKSLDILQKNILEVINQKKLFFILNLKKINLVKFSKQNKEHSKNWKNMMFFSNIFGLFAQPIFLIIILFNFYIQRFFFEDILLVSIYCIALLRVIPSASGVITFLSEIKSKLPSYIVTNNFIQKLTVSETLFEKEKNKSEKPVYQISKIEFKDLSFGYNKDLILKHVNLNIYKGEFIGIQGKSGIGKTTFFDLIMGFNLNYTGKILIDNISLLDLNLESFRENFTYISQDKFFFDMTIYENIIYGMEKAPSRDEIYKIFLNFNLNEIFDEKNFLDKKIYKNGVNLSGGQRQTIDILRGYVRNKNIFLFDESTNALDKKTEIQILNIIRTLSSLKKTVLIISHDNSVLEQCDRKYIIENKNITNLHS